MTESRELDIKDNRAIFAEKGSAPEKPEQEAPAESSEATTKPKIEMVVVPMNKRITVRIKAQKSVTDGGIQLLEETLDNDAPTQGCVMAVAIDCRPDVKDLVKEGMTVVFSKYAGVDIQPKEAKGPDSRDRYQILKEEDILAVLIDRGSMLSYVHFEEPNEQQPGRDPGTGVR